MQGGLHRTPQKRDFLPWSGTEKTLKRMRTLELTLGRIDFEMDSEKELETYTTMWKMALPSVRAKFAISQIKLDIRMSRTVE